MLKSPEEIPSGVFDLTSPIHPLINIHQHGCLIIVICHKLGAVDHVKLPVQIINMFLNGIIKYHTGEAFKKRYLLPHPSHKSNGQTQRDMIQ